MRVTVDGKQFACGGRAFRFRGVTYGTFRPRADGERFPEPAVVEADFAAMAEAGFTVVRTYTLPPTDVLDAAAHHGLRLLAGVHYPDWRYLVGSSRADRRRVARDAETAVRDAARQLRDRDDVLGLCVGNEVPADVVRWLGTGVVARAIARLAGIVRQEDPGRLVTYANYPTAEYLPLEALDFPTFNVFLERRNDFRRYLTRLHHLAGDRPLVLGEIGLDAGDGEPDSDGEKQQAQALDWQLEVACERGVAGACVFAWTDEWHVGDQPVTDWHFGLTRADRSPRPSLEVARQWNARTVRDVKQWWPPISVVICAHNEERHIDECLTHTCALDYPDLEIVVVDDGSTDRTAERVLAYPGVRLVRIPHSGLGHARNTGYAAATGALVAYLDADAYPSPDWLYYLALGLDNPAVGGVGGPNVPPRDDPPGAHRVARAPGGPVHVLSSDDRAEHVPGCNMAFLRDVLSDVGGCDPIYTSAGDDVDLCWKVLDQGWQIGFHPAALVWHHRRPGARAYFRQQRGYGRAEALVEARHPDRFTAVGTARWHGRIYDSFAPRLRRQRVYRGLYGTAAYQSVYQGGGHGLDLAHQLGIPAAVPAVAVAPLVLVNPWFGLPAVVALAGVGLLAAVDVARAAPPRTWTGNRLLFRLGVAGLHLTQPLVRTWGRLRHSAPARRDVSRPITLAGPARVVGTTTLLPADRQRAAITADVVAVLRRRGLRVLPATGWEDHDGCVIGSALVAGQLTTSAHPEGCVQVRLRPRLRAGPALVATLTMVAAGAVDPVAAVLTLAVVAVETGRGWWRAGPGAHHAIRRAAST